MYKGLFTGEETKKCAHVCCRLLYHGLGFESQISVCEPWIAAFQSKNAEGSNRAVTQATLMSP